jgi:hypothetical protein
MSASTAASPTMSDDASRLRFALPPELRQLHLFSKLPYDIRHKIWESIIYTPGIHFVKFERNDAWKPKAAGDASELSTSSDLSDDLTDDPQQHHRSYDQKQPFPKIEKSTLYSATLKPIFDTPHGDMSYYHMAFKTMATLWQTCEEAKYMVDQATNRPGALCFDDGTLISLDHSADVICIDYPDLLKTSRLGSWAKQLNPNQLTQIRRVAVRYQQNWDEMRRYCPWCGGYHDRGGGSHDTDNPLAKGQRPRHHLYEFAALFPNLEAFYLLDHMIVRKSSNTHTRPGLKHEDKQAGGTEDTDNRWLRPDDRVGTLDRIDSDGGTTKTGAHFRSIDRSYFEIDRNLCSLCKLQSNVFQMLEWVRERYVALCEGQPVKKKKHADPRNVRFSVLGCEWDQEKLVAQKKGTPTKDEMSTLPQQIRNAKSQRGNPQHEQSRQACQRQGRFQTPEGVDPLSVNATIVAMDHLALAEKIRDVDYNIPGSLPMFFSTTNNNTFPFTFRA